MIALILAILMAISPVRHIENLSGILWSDMHITIAGDMQDTGIIDTCSAVQIAVNNRKATDLTFLTARHCVIDTEENEGDGVFPIMMKIHPILNHIQFFDGDEGRIVSVEPLPFDDIAFVRVHSRRSHPIRTVYANPPPRGQSLYVFGDPEGNTWSLQTAMSMQGAVFNGLDDPWKHTYAIQCAACGPGDSGAGVWNHQGHLAGILVAGNGQESLIVPVSRIGITP